MAKYRKKPVIIDAWLWDGSENLLVELPQEVLMALVITTEASTSSGVKPCGHIINLKIKTLEGLMECPVGNWIIKGVNEEVYSCRPDIFKKTYDKIENVVVKCHDEELKRKFCE